MKERTGTVNCMIASIVICIIAELIGPLQFKVMGIDVKILTMIWVIIMGILLSPTLLGKVIPPLKKFISKAEIKRAPFLLSLTLYPLGIMFGINAGPKVGIVLQAGQEPPRLRANRAAGQQNAHEERFVLLHLPYAQERHRVEQINMPAEILQRDRAMRPFQAVENQLVHGAVNGNVDAHRVNASDDILLQTIHRIPESGRQRAVTMVSDGVAERIRRNRAAVRQRGRRQP